eukprot:Polyplicarium_translucidae@DN2766_c0_g2_i3.p2
MMATAEAPNERRTRRTPQGRKKVRHVTECSTRKASVPNHHVPFDVPGKADPRLGRIHGRLESRERANRTDRSSGNPVALGVICDSEGLVLRRVALVGVEGRFEGGPIGGGLRAGGTDEATL